ncbi:MAG: hypothetical protein A2V66_03530 [Ignavibacteria bacterium RBG_13_36_8]|nr:MAG: hypothetical protein A2V66_03530 [Ignavibacteria bacterium RBG_13_36_8]
MSNAEKIWEMEEEIRKLKIAFNKLKYEKELAEEEARTSQKLIADQREQINQLIEERDKRILELAHKN